MCNCNHEHHHHHEESQPAHQCGCAQGGCGGGGCCGSAAQDITFTKEEREFLLELIERQFLPMAQFVVKSSHTHEFEMVALSPVYLEDGGATMEEVRQTGDMLLRLEDLGLLTLDFDVPMDGGSYEIYEESALFAYLKETVAEGAKLGSYLGDIPVVERGSIGITEACYQRFSG